MTGTQKTLAFVAAAAVVAVILGIAFGGKDDPKKTPDAEPTSSGIVETTAAPRAPSPPPPTPDPSAAPIASGPPVNMATLAQEAKHVANAREALASGDAKKALHEIDLYEAIPGRNALTPEATMVKIEALSKVGRRTDALALGMSTRDDPKMASYQGRVEDILQDAGLISPPPPPMPAR
ncbi:MAG: hypothetical protein KIT84_33360 [Labilithrix sp.]|nr:hypothetical protein [Labilithrix sp.]MCW5815936.1 hypothetical protein [Labilithrix sp.]